MTINNTLLIKTSSWATKLQPEFDQLYFQLLLDFLERERSNFQVFPVPDEVFTAFELTPLSQVKVLILGQDPYHDVGQAHGLSFSVKKGVNLPPSLRNIYQELKTDLEIPVAKNGDLSAWARQGVLLLNAVLTVRAHQANSHKDQGWENFTDAVIRLVSDECPHVVFVLWGSYAQKKEKLIDTKKHTIIKTAHPSPLSASKGFFGSRPFSKTNEALLAAQQEAINWSLVDNIK